MNQFERKKIKENKASKDTWCDWLVNYIPEAEKKNVQVVLKETRNSFKIRPLDFEKK